MPQVEVSHNDSAARYEARLGDDVVGFAAYTIADGLVVFSHTATEPGYAGRGIASTVARYGLDDVRQRGDLKVVPQCWFIAEFIGRNPEYADLLAD